jgi:hypothetical protein
MPSRGIIHPFGERIWEPFCFVSQYSLQVLKCCSLYIWGEYWKALSETLQLISFLLKVFVVVDYDFWFILKSILIFNNLLFYNWLVLHFYLQ